MAFTYAVDTPPREDGPIDIAPTAKAKGEGFNRHRFGVGVTASLLLASAAARIHENRAQPGKMSKDESEA